MNLTQYCWGVSVAYLYRGKCVHLLCVLHKLLQQRQLQVAPPFSLAQHV